MEIDELRIIVHDGGILPVRTYPTDVGLDLYAPYDFVIPPHQRLLVDIKISVDIPNGHYGRIASRSGNSLKLGLEVGAGVIDIGYHGNVRVLLYNHSDKEVLMVTGSKIAQLILEKATICNIRVVESFNQSQRGNSGFGSTDNNKNVSTNKDDMTYIE